MNSRRNPRRLAAAVLVGVLAGGGLMATTPAGAEVAESAATNWKKIWKKNLKQHADKRYPTKSAVKSTYATKAEAAAAKAASDAATDGKLAGYYKKAEIDAKLAPFVNSVAATAGGDQEIALTPAPQVVRSVSLMPPANGTVIASSSAYINGAAVGVFRCSISTSTAIDASALQNVSPAVNQYASIAGTRGFAVTKGDLLTVNLVCDEFGGEAVLRDSALTAVFAPS